MFSSRTEWNLGTNRLTRLHREMLLKGESILDLTESNPSACGLTPPPEFIKQFADSRILSYSPDPKGLIGARQAISDYYAKLGAVVDPESIVLTSGTSEAYSFLFKMLCNPGEQILTPRPGYPLFDILAGLHDVEIRKYDLLYDGEWHLDRNSLKSALNSKVRAILLLHPSNPAGSYVKKEEWDFVAASAAPYDIPLIVDEVFQPFPIDSGQTAPGTFAGKEETPAVILNGLSKLAGLPQLKLAWMIINGSDPWRAEALSRLEMIADAFLSVSTAPQVVLPGILESIRSFSEPLHHRIKNNYSHLQSSSLGECTPLRCEGGWNAMIRVPATRTDEEWSVSLLNEMKVLVHPGFLFDVGTGTYLVLSLLPFPETFRSGVLRISNFFTHP